VMGWTPPPDGTNVPVAMNGPEGHRTEEEST
jgi:hypothetical protein